LNKKFFTFLLISISATISGQAATLVTGQPAAALDSFDLSSATALLSSNVSGTFPVDPTLGTFQANYTMNVYSDPNNVFGADNLDFVYQITDTGTGPHAGSQGVIEKINASFFDTFSVDAGYTTTALAGFTAGGSTSALADLEGGGGVVSFNYTGANELTVGTYTTILVVETNAKSYNELGILSAIDGSTATIAGLEPSSGTPEPGSMFLLGAGLVSLGVIGKRKKVKA
jgi:hypothetical protein